VGYLCGVYGGCGGGVVAVVDEGAEDVDFVEAVWADRVAHASCREIIPFGM